MSEKCERVDCREQTTKNSAGCKKYLKFEIPHCHGFTTTPTQSITVEQRKLLEQTCSGYLKEVDKIADLHTNEVQILQATITRYGEYLEFLDKANEGPIRLAYVHGWRCPQEDVDKGEELRAALLPSPPQGG